MESKMEERKLNLEGKIEGLLFYTGEPVKIKKLADMLGVGSGEIDDALKNLEENLGGRGLQLIYKDDKVMLGTRAELGPMLEKIRKEELTKDLSKPSIETLSIILYKNGVNRSEIDYVRGVNSSFILRNLQIRGLIERKTDPADSRKYIYMPTFEFLQYLGISRVEELPDYESVIKILNKEIDPNPPLEDGHEEITGESQDEQQ